VQSSEYNNDIAGRGGEQLQLSDKTDIPFECFTADLNLYKGTDKSLARIDNYYVKIKHISCLSSL